jgi:hypothetical protein
MDRAHFEHSLQADMADTSPSLDASDDFEVPASSTRYCPTALLGTFTLLMAGHGRCVNSSMMLGDREYAMWQLARAQTLPDDELHAIALRLFAYFDEPRSRVNVFA